MTRYEVSVGQYRWIPVIILAILSVSVVRQSFIGYLGEWDPHPNTFGFMLRLIPFMFLFVLTFVALLNRFIGGLVMMISGEIFGAMFGWSRLTRSYPGLGVTHEIGNGLWYIAEFEAIIVSTCGVLFIISVVIDGTFRKNCIALFEKQKVYQADRLKRLSEINK